MAPWGSLLRLLVTFEDVIIQQILRQPGFHRAVGRIHRMVNERKFDRDPNQPLRPGEATKDQHTLESVKGQADRFRKFFVEEIRNQARGTPTDLNRPSPEPPRRPKR